MNTIIPDESNFKIFNVTNQAPIDMDEFIEELDHCWEESIGDFNAGSSSVPADILINPETDSNNLLKPPEQVASIECPFIQEIVTKNQDGNEENSVYHCSACDVHLHNVMGHIKKFHKSQSVIIKSLDDNENDEIANNTADENNSKEIYQQTSQKFSLETNEIKLENESFAIKKDKKISITISRDPHYYENAVSDSFVCNESTDSINANQCNLITVSDELANESMEYNESTEFLDTESLETDHLEVENLETESLEVENLGKPTLNTFKVEIEDTDDDSYTGLMEVIEVNESYIAENLKDDIESDYIQTLDESENFEDLVIFNSKESSPKMIEFVEECEENSDSQNKINLNDSPKPEIQCEICLQKLKSNYNYRTHMKNYHPPRRQFEENAEFLCSICNTYFPTARNLGLHRKMHKMPYKMTTLEEATKYSSTKKEKLSEFFYCKLCNKKFDNNLKDAHKKFHEVENNEFLCTKCNRKYPNKIDYTYHMNIHEDEHEFEKPTKRLTKAEKLGIKLPYGCAFCGRTFARPYEKVKHERIHTGEKPFKCEVCGKCFRVSYSLTLHLRTHTNDRPYACSVCNKRFKSHGVYAHHLLTHSEARNFKCDECPKAFKTSVQLHGHKNSHKKPFNCLQCNRKFASMFAVKFHMETHKRVQIGAKYSCNICGAMYAREYALKDHLKEAHDNVNYEDATSTIFDDDLNLIEEDCSSSLNEEIQFEIE